MQAKIRVQRYDPESSDQPHLQDYAVDVPGQVSDLYRIPGGPDGELHGLTADGNLMTTFYRKDVFDSKGITYPTNWADAIDVSKEVHDPENGQYGHISCFQRGAWAF